jgi:hypothetical protein
VRGVTIEGDVVAGFAVGTVASWFSKGILDSELLMVPGVV